MCAINNTYILIIVVCITLYVYIQQTKEMEHFMNGYQNPPKRTSYANLYFPGNVTGNKVVKKLPSMHYKKMYSKPRTELVEFIQKYAV